jgi:ribonuclease R
MNTTSEHRIAHLQDIDNITYAVGAFDRFRFPAEGQSGHLALVDLKRRKVLEHLGQDDDVGAIINALTLHAQEVDFTPQQEEMVVEPVKFLRKDLKSLTTFTIDGPYTQDFDDAISARFEDAGIRVWVHVADVSAYVRAGSLLDKLAYERATSIYLPTVTIPMLPRSLSTGACSLVQGQERAAVTAEFLLREGRVVERSFYRSLICSDARLTYDHVDDIFLGTAQPGPTYAAALAAARSAAISRPREETIRSEEMSYIIEHGQVVGQKPRLGSESQTLIERLMVLANEQVASFLNERAVPVLYRNHSLQDVERIRKVAFRLQALGIRCEQTVESIQKAMDDYQAAHGENQALQMMLWGLRGPATYEQDCTSHESLGLQAYTHFTSPIRRYADLLVHRALLAEIGADDIAQTTPHSQLTDVAQHIMQRNKTVRKLARQAASICQVSLMKHRQQHGLALQGAGQIVGMSKGGCFVEFAGVQGMLSRKILGGSCDEHCVIWSRPEGTLRIGDQVGVAVSNTNLVRGQVDFSLC